MKNINHFTCASLLLLLVGCSSMSKTYVAYSDWDLDNDKKISRKEFVDAYRRQDYFERWSSGSSSIHYSDLFLEAFTSIDSDHDQKLSIIEFNSQMKSFYFGLFNDGFTSWDDDSNASISKQEFTMHANNSKLASMWDTDGNGRISEGEMAGGMFYVCDLDSNGSVDNVELDSWKRNRQRATSAAVVDQ